MYNFKLDKFEPIKLLYENGELNKQMLVIRKSSRLMFTRLTSIQYTYFTDPVTVLLSIKPTMQTAIDGFPNMTNYEKPWTLRLYHPQNLF